MARFFDEAAAKKNRLQPDRDFETTSNSYKANRKQIVWYEK